MSRAGVLVMLVGLAVVGAIAGPNLVMARYRGAQKRTMGDMRTIGTAIESWSIDHRGYPVVSSVAELAPLVEPTYVKVLPRVDGWGRAFEVASDGRNYVISSRGGDGLWARESLPRLPNGGFVGLSTGEIIRGWFRLVRSRRAGKTPRIALHSLHRWRPRARARAFLGGHALARLVLRGRQ